MLHWLLVRKNAELRRGVSAWKKNKCYRGQNDLELKSRLKKAASTIVPCLKGDHSLCNQHSFVCIDSKDPFLSLLPHKQNVSSLTDQMQKTLSESVWSVFQSQKLDRLINQGTLRTTSRVEAVHRTIRAPVPKGKVLRRNQTAVLQMGATIAASNGRGHANLSHFRHLGIPISSQLARRMKAMDGYRRNNAKRRKTIKSRNRATELRRLKFESHGRSLETAEAKMYAKEAFSDHTYAQTSRLAGEFCSFGLFSLLFFDSQLKKAKLDTLSSIRFSSDISICKKETHFGNENQMRQSCASWWWKQWPCAMHSARSMLTLNVSKTRCSLLMHRFFPHRWEVAMLSSHWAMSKFSSYNFRNNES